MLHIHHLLNPVGIFVCTAILWILGAVWYSPVLFAKPWMTMAGVKKEDGKKSWMYLGMVSSLLCDFVIALALDHLVVWSSAGTFGWGAMIGFIAWCGFYAAPTLPQGIYEGRPFKLFAINGGYWLLGFAVVGGVLAVWK